MHKKIIISISIIGVIIIALAIGAYFYIQKQNKKLSLGYVISQCKEEGSYEEEEEESPDIYKGTKYICYNKDYNQIVKFKKDAKSSEETFAFRIETAEDVGNGGNKFNYETGRIVIDTVNPQASKCTYNYRGNADWKPCIEKEFIHNLPEISLLKSKAYETLKPLLKEMQERDANSYYGSGKDTQYNEDKLQEACEKYEKQIKVLQNTTILK